MYVIAGQFVLGFAVDGGGQVGDLVAKRRYLGVPWRVTGDVNVERFSGQYPRLGQHRQRGVGAVWVKPSGGLVPVEVALAEQDQHLVWTAPLQPVGDLFIDPLRSRRTRGEHHD